MSKLSGIRDLDREILGKIEDKDLLKVCSIDKYTWNIVCDDSFLRRRMCKKYPEIENYKFDSETWKLFFKRAIYYITLLKQKFDYDYTFGIFFAQYNILKVYSKNKNSILAESSRRGELALVIWSLKKGADIHHDNDYALRWASERGYFEIVKYLVENGANIHASEDWALITASGSGHLEIVKYLADRGSNINSRNNLALRWAVRGGKTEVVNYLLDIMQKKK